MDESIRTRDTAGFLRAVGDELRRARRAAGLALRDVGRRSDREFKASAVGGYERGERSISLLRFCRLAELYGVEPQDLLARIVARAAGPAARREVIDIRSLPIALASPEGGADRTRVSAAASTPHEAPDQPARR